MPVQLEAISPRSPSAAHPAKSLPLFVALITLLASFLRFGYWYGSGDQDELLPSVLHLLDGSLFTQDWLIQTVASGINVRTFFLWLAALPSFVFPSWLTFFLLWAVVTVAVAYGVYALAFELLGDRLSAAAGTLAACVVTVRWTLGSNALLYDLLTPEGVAWALAVPAIPLALQQRWTRTGLLLGLATWFHLLAGAQTALVLGLIGIARAAARADLDGTQLRADLVDLARFGGAFVLVALPILVPVALDQLRPATPGGVPIFYIHAQFRNPHHHLFSAFPLGHHIRFWPLIGVGVIAGWWLARRGALRHGRTLIAGGVLIATLGALAVVFVELVPVALVAKLQFFKLTVLVTLVATLLLVGALVTLLPDVLIGWANRLLGRRRLGLGIALAACGLVGLLAVQNVSRPGALVHPLRHLETPLGEVEQWAQAETPADALFAVPPSVSTFRSFAHRAVVANFNGFVFSERDMQTWFARLMDIAPIAPQPGGLGLKPVLDAAYHVHTATDWRQLQAGYGIDFVLVEKPSSLALPLAFENEAWAVYRLSEEPSNPEAR